jgi:hypothetical protein
VLDHLARGARQHSAPTKKRADKRADTRRAWVQYTK